MGYDISYQGAFRIVPALSSEQRGELSALHDTADARGGPRGRCCWKISDDGLSLAWDGCEKFVDAEAWLRFLITTFFGPWQCALAGSVRWEGEDGATGTLSVDGNVVTDAPDEPSTAIDDEVASWINVLQTGKPDMRVVAASELGCAAYADSASKRAAVEALAGALGDSDIAVKALETLGELGEAAGPAAARVMAALESPNAKVRYWATYALGRFGAAAKIALPALERLKNDREDGPRYGAIDAIKRLS